MQTNEFVQISLARYNQFYELQKAESKNRINGGVLNVITMCLDDGIILKVVDLMQATLTATTAKNKRVTGKFLLRMRNKKLELHYDPVEFFTQGIEGQNLDELSKDCHKVTDPKWAEFFCEILGIDKYLIDLNPEIA